MRPTSAASSPTSSGSTDDPSRKYSRTYGADTLLNFTPEWSANGFYVGTSNPGISGETKAWKAEAQLPRRVCQRRAPPLQHRQRLRSPDGLRLPERHPPEFRGPGADSASSCPGAEESLLRDLLPRQVQRERHAERARVSVHLPGELAERRLHRRGHRGRLRREPDRAARADRHSGDPARLLPLRAPPGRLRHRSLPRLRVPGPRQLGAVLRREAGRLHRAALRQAQRARLGLPHRGLQRGPAAAGRFQPLALLSARGLEPERASPLLAHRPERQRGPSDERPGDRPLADRPGDGRLRRLQPADRERLRAARHAGHAQDSGGRSICEEATRQATRSGALRSGRGARPSAPGRTRRRRR